MKKSAIHPHNLVWLLSIIIGLGSLILAGRMVVGVQAASQSSVLNSETCTTYYAEGLPWDIPDDGMLGFELIIDDSITITDLNLTLDITHPNVSELIGDLVAPDQVTTVNLFSDLPPGADFTGTTFDDEAAAYIYESADPYTGSYKPVEPLSGFDGMDANGQGIGWVLQLTDGMAGNAGMLNSWSLEVCSEPVTRSITVLKLDQNWQPLPGLLVELYAGPGCGGTAQDDAVTGTDGLIDFTGLPPGSYSVREIPPPEWVPLTPLCQNVDLTDSFELGPYTFDEATYPLGGDDTFDSGAHLLLDVTGLGSDEVALNGLSQWVRYDPGDGDSNGRTDVGVEIVALELSGDSPTLGSIILLESPMFDSLGQIEEQAAGTFYPADSFFDLYVELFLDDQGMFLHTETPLRLESVITSTLPLQQVYYDLNTPVLLYDDGGAPAGEIMGLVYVPLEPGEKLVVFHNTVTEPTDTPTPTSTNTATPTDTPTSTPEPSIELNRHTFGGGGGQVSGTSLKLEASIGQPSAIGEVQGSSLTLRGGFWHAPGTSIQPPTPTPTATSTPTNTPTPTDTPTETPTETPTSTPEPSIQLNRHTFGSGGGQVSGISLKLDASIGQPSAIGEVQGSDLRIRGGFWHASVPLPVSIQISPGQGGSLASPDGKINLSFPPGAVDGLTTVTYIPLTGPTGGGGNRPSEVLSLIYAGTAFRLEAVDDNGDPVTAFNLPFTITLTYADAQWIDAGISDESSLNLFWNTGIDNWTGLLPCGGCSVDTETNLLTALFDQTGEFALFGDGEYRIYLPMVVR